MNMNTTRIKLLLARAAAMLALATLAPPTGVWAADGNISGSGTEGDPYLIEDAADYAVFANVNNKATYWASGVYVKLTADIGTAESPITATVGTTSSNLYSGVFDGNGKTLTVSITGYNYAPFSYISGATIKNLTIQGTVSAYNSSCSGLVGICYSGTNTIIECRVAANINYSVSYCGGIVGDMKSSTLTLTNCVFSGSINTGNYGEYIGGLVGWSENDATLTIDNCLFSGTYSGNGAFHPIAVRNKNKSVTTTVTRAYYTRQPSKMTDAYTVAPGIFVSTTVPNAMYSTLNTSFGLYYAPVVVTGVSEDAEYAYTGEPIVVDYKVSDADGTLLTEGTDYTLSYVLNNTSVASLTDKGDYTLTISGKGDTYKGTTSIRQLVVRSQLAGEGTQASPYLIEDASDWSALCSSNNSNKYYNKQDLYFKLTADISVKKTTVTNYTLSGHFDGGGHTITATFGSPENYNNSGSYFGLFYSASNISFKYLHVAGEIYRQYGGAGGIVGSGSNISFNNCRSSVIFHTKGTYSAFAGFKGYSANTGITFTHCLFDGQMLHANTTDTNDSFYAFSTGSATLTDCLAVPSALSIPDGRFYLGNGGTYTQCYYTGSATNGQGEDASTLDAATLAAYLGGWQVSGAKVLPYMGDDTHLGTSVISGVRRYFYHDGNKNQPEPVVTDINGQVLTKGTDYTLSWSSDAVEVGDSYLVTATGKGNYTGSASWRYAVTDGEDLTSTTTQLLDGHIYRAAADLTINDRITVNGDVILGVVSGATLTAKNGIEVTQDNNATLTIKGPGTLLAQNSTAGSAGIGSTYLRHAGTIIIDGGTVEAYGVSNGAGIGPANLEYSSTVIINGGKVKAVGAGEGAGIGSASSTVTLNWTDNAGDYIDATSIAGTVTLANDFYYDGTKTLVTSENLTENQGKKLIPRPVYNLTAVAPHGTMVFTVDGKEVTATFVDKEVTATVTPDEGYSTKAVAVTYNDGANSVSMTKVSDDVWTFVMPEAAATATASFKRILQDSWISAIAAQTYSGLPQQPALTVKDGDTELAVNTDYTVAYKDNLNVGTATATITAAGENYSGTASATFAINKAALTVTANAKTITYGDEPANEGVQYTGFVNGETAAVLGGTLNYTYLNAEDAAYAVGSPVGVYRIIPSGLTSSNYTISFVEGVMTVVQKEVGLAWGETTFDADGTEKLPAATATGLVGDDVCAVTVTGAQTAVGSYTATATALSNANYKLPEEVTSDFTILRDMSDVFATGCTWATYVAQENLATPAGLTAYVVSGATTSTITTEEAAFIPAGVGVLLSRTDVSVANYKGSAYTGGAVAPTSLLKGSATTATAVTAYKDYVLSNGEFVLTSASTIAASKAYLPAASTPAGAPSLAIDVNGNGTTGINSVGRDNTTADEDWYDLNGRKLQNTPTRKGLYIRNGRKVVIK